MELERKRERVEFFLEPELLRKDPTYEPLRKISRVGASRSEPGVWYCRDGVLLKRGFRGIKIVLEHGIGFLDFASLSRLAQTNLWIGGPGARVGGGQLLHYVKQEQWRIRKQKDFLAMRREFLAGLAKSHPDASKMLAALPGTTLLGKAFFNCSDSARSKAEEELFETALLEDWRKPMDQRCFGGYALDSQLGGTVLRKSTCPNGVQVAILQHIIYYHFSDDGDYEDGDQKKHWTPLKFLTHLHSGPGCARCWADPKCRSQF
jgi:hypothetical protein